MPSNPAPALLCDPWQVLPPLVEVIPEARLNLVIFYLRRGDPLRAHNLIKGLEPSTAFEYICKVGGQQGRDLQGAGPWAVLLTEPAQDCAPSVLGCC